MLFVYPPLARSTEPPLGIARLSAALKARGETSECLDLCQEGYDYLFGLDVESNDAWTAGAFKRRERNLALIRGPQAMLKPDAYKRAVLDLNKCLRSVSAPRGLLISLSDYQDSGLSPLRRQDLLESARRHKENIFFPHFERRVAEKLGGQATVGISLCFLSQALPAFALMGFLRSRYPAARIVLGGGLVTSWLRQGAIPPGDTFSGLADVLIPGRGEDPLLEFLGLDLLPDSQPVPPDFSDLADLSYFSPRSVIPYDFSSGCPYLGCRFCPEVAEGSPYRGRPPETARRELVELVRLHAPGLLHFTDSEIGQPYLRMLADGSPGAPWYGFARFSPLLEDPRFCDRLAQSGCAMLQLGLESGDQSVLDSMGKGTELSRIGTILENLAASGISAYVYALFGTQAEDLESARRTLGFIERNADRIGFLNVAIFNLPASSPDAASLETREFFEGDLSLYREFRHPLGWNRDKVRSFLTREFEASPLIRPILMRNPPSFTSNHAAFFPPRPSA